MLRGLRFTNAQVEAALIEANGLVTHAARKLSCAPNTIDAYVKRSPQLQETLRWEREKLVDLAEDKFRGHIEDGNLTAIHFALSTLGKNRGYVTRTEQEIDAKVGIVEVSGVPSASRGR